MWPKIKLYSKERQIIRSVERNGITVVPAGNKLGKDFTSAFIVLWFFLTRNPCRIITTSVDSAQLEGVLWGEMRNFIETSRFPLKVEKGGPLIVNHLHIRKWNRGAEDGLSYIKGRVAAKGEGLQGHHLPWGNDGRPHTFGLIDEASGMEDEPFQMIDTWAHRQLIIGNPWPCNNYFKYAVNGKLGTNERGGDLRNANGIDFYRKILRIRAEDSPNVQLGIAQKNAGEVPTDEILVPGVKRYSEYLSNRLHWDEIKQCVGLDARFWEGAEVLFFPVLAINAAETLAEYLRGIKRKGRGLGIDPGEGVSNTSWTVTDEKGVLEIVSYPTPKTNVIPSQTIALGKKWGIEPENWVFDSGGGGLQIADQMREDGYDVRSVAFGSSPLDPPEHDKHTKFAYTSRRSQMYGEMRELLLEGNFAIPIEWSKVLRPQMASIPLLRDKEGRLKMLPKHRQPGSNEKCLVDLIGHSPDELDSTVLSIHAWKHPVYEVIAGVFK